MASEKTLEKKLRQQVDKLGGKCLKWASPYYTGMPDRVILLPGGNIIFVELKGARNKLTDLQSERMKMLKALGFATAVVDGEQALDKLMEVIYAL